MPWVCRFFEGPGSALKNGRRKSRLGIPDSPKETWKNTRVAHVNGTFLRSTCSECKLCIDQLLECYGRTEPLLVLSLGLLRVLGPCMNLPRVVAAN